MFITYFIHLHAYVGFITINNHSMHSHGLFNINSE